MGAFAWLIMVNIQRLRSLYVARYAGDSAQTSADQPSPSVAPSVDSSAANQNVVRRDNTVTEILGFYKHSLVASAVSGIDL